MAVVTYNRQAEEAEFYQVDLLGVYKKCSMKESQD